MNQEYGPNSETSPELGKFREDFRAVVEAENERGTAHFRKMKSEDYDFDPADLQAEDMEIWKKIKNGSVTIEEFRAYRAKIEKFMISRPGSKEAVSRNVFLSYAANKANSVLMRQELEKTKEETK